MPVSKICQHYGTGSVFVCLHAVTSPSLLCSISSPRPSPLGKELRLLAVGVLLGVEGGQ